MNENIVQVSMKFDRYVSGCMLFLTVSDGPLFNLSVQTINRMPDKNL